MVHTSAGDTYFKFGTLTGFGTQSHSFTFNGALPSDYKPIIQVVVAEAPRIPDTSPTPPSGDEMGPVSQTVFIQSYESISKIQLSSSQAENLAVLVDYIQDDPNIKDLRWAAYMLATADTETAHTFSAFTEEVYGGRNKANLYWLPVKDPNGNDQVYFGRGYVAIDICL